MAETPQSGHAISKKTRVLRALLVAGRPLAARKPHIHSTLGSEHERMSNEAPQRPKPAERRPLEHLWGGKVTNMSFCTHCSSQWRLPPCTGVIWGVLLDVTTKELAAWHYNTHKVSTEATRTTTCTRCVSPSHTRRAPSTWRAPDLAHTKNNHTDGLGCTGQALKGVRAVPRQPPTGQLKPMQNQLWPCAVGKPRVCAPASFLVIPTWVSGALEAPQLAPHTAVMYHTGVGHMGSFGTGHPAPATPGQPAH